MFKSDHSIVPVVMFHSVGLEDDRYWPMDNISEPVDIFRRKLEVLKRSGYEFWHLNKLYAYKQSGRCRSHPAIVLTFDDGYLDNWVYVFPLLREYGIKATIYVNPEFVDPGTDTRATYDDVLNGRLLESELQIAGFLNWTELREMEESGLVDIQSHTMTHTWYFSGPRLIDFYNPSTNQYPWMAWNERPDQKPFYMSSDQSRLVRWGTPIYEHEKALICRRYFPPPELSARIADFVAQSGGETFFAQQDWYQKLNRLYKKLKLLQESHGRYESEPEYKARVFDELADSKRIIEEKLNKSVDYISWPGGGYNETALSAALDLGYKAWTYTSRENRHFKNRPGSDPRGIKRIASVARYRSSNGENCGFAGERFFANSIERHKGSFLAKWKTRLMKHMAVFRNRAFAGLVGRKN